MRFISSQLLKQNITNHLCPDFDNIFKAYEYTQPDDVKVVIIGQDPYYDGVSAHGLSFSTLGTKMPPSLRVIFDELVDSGISNKRRSEKNLTDWAKQGVLLLNSILTTEKGKALTHESWGWQNFTGATIKYLIESPQPVVYLLWGENAKTLFSKSATELGKNNHVMVSCHPAAQLYGGKNKFVGNKHFVRTNEILKACDLNTIKWH